MRESISSILSFWFEECTPKQWWSKDAEFDQLIRSRFSDLHNAATSCELFDWRESVDGCLAEVIVLDQFSRNMYRDQPAAFASDGMALVLAQTAIERFDVLQLPAERRTFLYLPYMHSESRLIHEVAVKLFSDPGLEENYRFELRHKEIIDRFGRYPHRNAVLGRVSTPEEIEFLKQPGSSF